MEIERFICVVCLGLLEGIKDKAISIVESMNFLISPYSARILKRKGIDKELVDIIFLLCELEDVESIIPDKLNVSIEDAKKKIKEYLLALPKPQLPKDHWIEDK